MQRGGVLSQMKTRDIEVAVANHFGYRRNLIVPRVSWGLDLHECDMLILSNAGYASEVEIKVSKSDLLRDSDKSHRHNSNKVKALWFAVPESLGEFALTNTALDVGVFVVCENSYRGKTRRCKILRPAKLRVNSRKFTEGERHQLARLGLMRYWSIRSEAFDTEKEFSDGR